jgi:hypothetical protein
LNHLAKNREDIQTKSMILTPNIVAKVTGWTKGKAASVDSWCFAGTFLNQSRASRQHWESEQWHIRKLLVDDPHSWSFVDISCD